MNIKLPSKVPEGAVCPKRIQGRNVATRPIPSRIDCVNFRQVQRATPAIPLPETAESV
jgi:hypothetical protein